VSFPRRGARHDRNSSFIIHHPALQLKTWTLLELLRWTTGYLGEKGVPEPRLTAELLLAGALRLKRLDLYLQFERPLREEELAEFKARLRRRTRREPLQYIEGEASFRDLRLRVDRRVLIPRPETEVLVGEVLRWAQGRRDLRLLDVGTGSGAIALSLATEGPFAAVVATDVSLDALEVARENHRLVRPAVPVEFRAGSVYGPVAGERYDVIASNPPYIGSSEAAALEPEVREWEPVDALFAGHSGLDVIEALVAGAPAHLATGGLLALEIGAAQAGRVTEMVRAVRGFSEPRVRRDLAGRDRIVLAEYAGVRTAEH
jgi:release factor glutamine methyltransferase